MDVEYVEKMSFKLDIKILFKTFLNVILSKNISVNTNEVEPSFIEYRLKKIKIIKYTFYLLAQDDVITL